jgi:hypothetical protein
LNLITQEDFESSCPAMIQELENFIDLHPGFKGKPEATVYALAQLLNDRVEVMELDGVEKGAIIHAVVAGFIEMNEQELALYQEYRRTLVEQKASTKH